MSRYFNKKQAIFGILGIIAMVVFFLTDAPEGLPPEGWHSLGIFVMAVFFWIGGTLPDFVTCLFMQMMLVITKCVPLATAYSAWSGGVIWIVIPVFVIGAALSKTGFLRRVVLKIMSWFSGSWSKQILALFVAGNVVNPLVPSQTAKVSIAAPLCSTYNRELGFEDGSKSAVGFFATAWLAFGGNGGVWLTGTTMTFTMTGLLAAQYQNWTFMQWIGNAWPLLIALFVICCGAIILFYKPKDAKPISKEFSKAQYEALGPMSKEEKISAAVLVLCIILWILEKTIGIAAASTAQLGMVALLALKILDRNDFRNKIAWESVVFIAASTSLASVFSKTGISDWVGATFTGMLSPLFVNPAVMVVATCIIIYLFRFVFVSQTALMTIFVVACAPMAEAAGINPWCFGFIVMNVVNCFPTKYTNATVLTALAASGNMCEFKQVSKMSHVYLLACIVGILCCIPIWMLHGLC